MSTNEIEARILDLIPHRPPFLFVDRILESGERSMKTERTFRADEPFFAGHYPGDPIVPGVILCEAVFQTGALLIASTEKLPAGAVPVLTRAGDAKFRRIVRPGEKIEISVEITEKMANAYFMKGSVACGGKNSVRVEFAVSAVAGSGE